MRAYIHTGCNIITIRKTAAEELQLSIHPTSHSIRGYAGGITQTYGTVNVNLTVDLITAKPQTQPCIMLEEINRRRTIYKNVVEVIKGGTDYCALLE
jgi:hypothetical protein